MKKIYLITTGSYSDYNVDCAFSTKEAAQLYHDKIIPYESELNDVEECDLDPLPEDWIPEPCVTVYMNKDGIASTYGPDLESRRGFMWYIGTGDYSRLVWAVATDDPEKAIKVVAEKRTEILTLGIWGDTEKTEEARL